MKTKPSLSFIIILLLLLVIVLQRSCNNSISTPSEKIVIQRDTVWKHTHDTIYKNLKPISEIYTPIDDEQYESGETIDTCKKRFQLLLKDHLTKRIYVDTLKLDSIGHIVVKDTVWINKLYGKRLYIKDYKIPVVTNTITITKQEEPKRQLYVGANLFANRNDITVFSPGFIYKNKKEQLYQATIGIDFNGTITYGFGTYWKIKMK